MMFSKSICLLEAESAVVGSPPVQQIPIWVADAAGNVPTRDNCGKKLAMLFANIVVHPQPAGERPAIAPMLQIFSASKGGLRR